MWEPDLSVPDDLGYLAVGAVEAGEFDDESAVVAAALAALFEDEDLRRAGAAGFYARADRATVGSAARLAGVSRAEMPAVLADHGVEPRTGPDDEDLAAEIDDLRESFDG
jgi:predicted HTH domain antitoxin